VQKQSSSCAQCGRIANLFLVPPPTSNGSLFLLTPRQISNIVLSSLFPWLFLAIALLSFVVNVLGPHPCRASSDMAVALCNANSPVKYCIVLYSNIVGVLSDDDAFDSCCCRRWLVPLPVAIQVCPSPPLTLAII
jgi:hypothetical protein